MADENRYILTLSCHDRPGIVAGVATTLANAGCNILESNQFDDLETGRFFMRVVFHAPAAVTVGDVKAALGAVAKHFEMAWDVIDTAVKARLIVMVSKFDHCLQDLLYRARMGSLPVDIVAIVSNHEASRPTAEQHGIPFHHWPVTPETKAAQEERLFALVDEVEADLVVLARYMQVLSDAASVRISGRAINIHHSFLPAFKGAAPYSQAHERGTKLIGATAHYVTGDLDEGPIIEQDAERVTHADSAESMMVKGREIEARVLARAVKAHVERRVFINGVKTVVFG
ncbi:formyltetrahydrofolate deformylase [Chthonobacter albigriseus]|uniref:formyltetrahydrofolate deformylase n=1 Tax=Chthonobacter albigriseus TaxID=1683161 RepID=UPI0015EF7BC1|nr:formyltetrahydrofolate deformylase [Chthonobacter albigriseus]